MYKKLKLVESASDRYQVREYDGPGAKFAVYDTKEKKFIQKGPKYIMVAACDDLNDKNNKNKKLKESSTEEYWDATEIIRDGFMSLMKFNFGTDSRGNNYIITKDAYDLKRFHANNDEDAKNYFRGYLNLEKDNFGDYSVEDDEALKNKYHINESTKLTEDLDDEEELEDIQDDVKEDLENQEELEDTVDSEEDQEENPVEEESELDTQLNELRDILVDLDLNLYQITDKEDLNNSVYIIGKVAEDSDEVLMLVDTKPEDVNSEEIPEEEPIIDKIDIDNADIDNDLEESALKESKENKLTWEQFEEAMTNASKEGKEIKGVIVFSPESFDKEYSEESRSYRVSSNNKYWEEGKLGSSLFGYCLDGTDQGARLDWYMKAVPEDGLGKRWIVDYCYLEDDNINEAEDTSSDLEKAKKIIENCGFTIQDENVDYSGNETGWEIQQYTPEGEDWFVDIIVNNDVNKLIDEISSYAENFDIDEETEPYIEMRGQRGIPSSISALIEDAKWKKDQLTNLANELKKLKSDNINETAELVKVLRNPKNSEERVEIKKLPNGKYQTLYYSDEKSFSGAQSQFDDLDSAISQAQKLRPTYKLDEADNNTYSDEDEAAYYRNKELYANSNLSKHREAMEKAAKACKEKGIKLEEKMNGLISTNSNAEELFAALQDAEDIDTEKWNNSSSEERIEMVKPIIINFYKENKDKINDNWRDFMELLEYWNYHTEYKIFKELKNNINEAEEIDLENNEESEEDEHKTELEQRFDFVKLPNTFEEINKLNPRYGEELTPDHEAIIEYLMNCLIEINPEAAEDLQNNEEDEETPIEPEEDIDLDIDINGEEDLDNED